MLTVGRVLAAAERHLQRSELNEVLHRSHDHVVLEVDNAIIKSGTRDPFALEAWAIERARAHGVPAPTVIAVEPSGDPPILILSRVRGIALCDERLPADAARFGAEEAGAMLSHLHRLTMDGFGWADVDAFRATGVVMGKSGSWIDEVDAEFEGALDFVADRNLISENEVSRLRDARASVTQALASIGRGRFLHGDLGRMHIFVDPNDGRLTGLIDWGDLQAGDPVWDLAMASCHFMSPSEGVLRFHDGGQSELFPHLLAGYAPSEEMQARIGVVMPFYCAYRLVWASRMRLNLGLSANRTLQRALLALPSASARQ